MEYFLAKAYINSLTLNLKAIFMKFSIGNDHAGTSYKKAIVSYLESEGHTVINHGTNDSESVDYPDYGHPVATDVTSGTVDLGIVICGSGNGIAMTVNKHDGIRAALAWIREIAILGRLHNNANVVAIPARYTSENQAVEIVKAFIETDFEAGRHKIRVDKIGCM